MLLFTHTCPVTGIYHLPTCAENLDIFPKNLYDNKELKNERQCRRGVHIEALTERTAQVERRFRETDVEGSFGAGFLKNCVLL